MQTKPMHTVVDIPHAKKLDVTYYCSDTKLDEEEKKEFANLIIQLDDCHTSIKIKRSKAEQPGEVEAIVQRKVINAKGHLCD